MIWQRLGNPSLYIEPFAGSLSVLLWRPNPPGSEVINDVDGHVINTWRAIKAVPHAVAAWLSRPLSEIDLFAMWKQLNEAKLVDQLKADINFCDATLAGMWIAGANLSVGRPWCTGKQAPRLNLGRKEWFFQDRKDAEVLEYLDRLAGRLRHVVMYCGSWERAVSPTGLYTVKRGATAIFFDPPYLLEKAGERTRRLYAKDNHSIARDVAEWCREHGKQYRIVLAGLEGHYKLPGWKAEPWKRFEGFAAYDANGDTKDKSKHKEVLLVSPACDTVGQWSI